MISRLSRGVWRKRYIYQTLSPIHHLIAICNLQALPEKGEDDMDIVNVEAVASAEGEVWSRHLGF